MANVRIYEDKNKATGYFGSGFDFCQIDLEAYRTVSEEEADVLIEHGAISEDDVFVEYYKPNQVVEALKKFTELVESGWKNVKLKFYLKDSEGSDSYVYLVIEHKEGWDLSIRSGVILKKALTDELKQFCEEAKLRWKKRLR